MVIGEGILHSMKGIDPKIMMKIWRELVVLERSSDFELATRAKIAHGNITNWQSPNPPKLVRFSTLKQIEDNLGYSIDVSESGKYKITKRSASYPLPGESISTGLREPQLDFSRTVWKSDEDKKKFYETIKKLSEADPADREALYRIIDSIGK
jgi:hypothetical protein